MSQVERNIEWLMALSRAQFNSTVYGPNNKQWRASLTDEQKAELARKSSIANKGKVRSEETCHKIRMSKLGKPLPRTPEWQAKITAALTGRKGHKHDDEAKRKISIANKGRLKGIVCGPQSVEHKQNYKNSRFAAGKTSPCQTPLGTFNSRADAAKAHGVDPASISNWMKKEKPGFFYLEQKDVDKCKQDREKWLIHLGSKPCLKRDRSVKTPVGVFPSIRSAAKAIGIDQSTLSDRIKRGSEGYEYIVTNV